MTDLSNLPPKLEKASRRVGRGVGCKKGKTCGRGHKGDKSRSGYKKRGPQQGGNVPLYKKLPTRGFTRGRFKKEIFAINLGLIEELFDDGEIVNAETLASKGFSKTKLRHGFKVLSKGELNKKVTIEANGISKQALVKLEDKKIDCKLMK